MEHDKKDRKIYLTGIAGGPTKSYDIRIWGLVTNDTLNNERISRPGGFPTSLDVINYVSDEWGQDAVDIANKRFWDKFSQTKWGGTKLVVSYMIEDDYDSKAYDMLISHLKSSKMQICGKGIHGRHNDASGDIVAWFKAQYDQILYEDFGIRKK